MKKVSWQGKKAPSEPAEVPPDVYVAPAGPPNKRGKGGRPTTGQKAEEGALDGAREVLQTVQEANPPTFQMRPNQSQWAKNFDREERLVEQQEAEAILSARKERLDAIQEQTTILKANRRIALGFSGTAMQLLKSMQRAAAELDKRLVDNLEDLSFKELREVIQVTGSTVVKAQSAVEAMVKTERYVMRHPLDLSEEEQDDLAELDPDGAKRILENLSKSVLHIAKKFDRDNAIEVPPEEPEKVYEAP
ncbi:MAG: hypothetical protein E6Q97_04420 [Desulfurellales bacterium]|nr:MAG: hypothetical protein E6Q97_04420 [Desulfurellales bacterium]